MVKLQNEDIKAKYREEIEKSWKSTVKSHILKRYGTNEINHHRTYQSDYTYTKHWFDEKFIDVVEEKKMKMKEKTTFIEK